MNKVFYYYNIKLKGFYYLHIRILIYIITFIGYPQRFVSIGTQIVSRKMKNSLVI